MLEKWDCRGQLLIRLFQNENPFVREEHARGSSQRLEREALSDTWRACEQNLHGKKRSPPVQALDLVRIPKNGAVYKGRVVAPKLK